jgi:hypothetical protein
MDAIALQLEQSVDAAVSASFAWRFRTDITTWIDPPASFVLDGPFVTGVQGTTVMPGQEPRHWWIRDVQPGRSFVIEMPLERATLCFRWRFDALSERRTRVTQQIELSGSNAANYVEQVREAFGSTLEGGMNRVVAEMVAAAQATDPTENDTHRTSSATGA